MDDGELPVAVQYRGRVALLRRAIEPDVEVPERETLLWLALPCLMAAGRRETILTELRRASESPPSADEIIGALVASDLDERDRPPTADLEENPTAQGETA